MGLQSRPQMTKNKTWSIRLGDCSFSDTGEMLPGLIHMQVHGYRHTFICLCISYECIAICICLHMTCTCVHIATQPSSRQSEAHHTKSMPWWPGRPTSQQAPAHHDFAPLSYAAKSVHTPRCTHSPIAIRLTHRNLHICGQVVQPCQHAHGLSLIHI